MKTWARAAAIRAIKTMAQSAIAMIGTSVVISDIDWKLVASASVVAGVLSVLTSIAGLPEVDGAPTIYIEDELDDDEDEDPDDE